MPWNGTAFADDGVVEALGPRLNCLWPHNNVLIDRILIQALRVIEIVSCEGQSREVLVWNVVICVTRIP